jgi:hypothetical protein
MAEITDTQVLVALSQLTNGEIDMSKWLWYAELHLNSDLPTVITNLQANTTTPFVIDKVLVVDDHDSIVLYRSQVTA